MTIFYFMSIIAIISDFSFQIPTSEKSLKLIYVLFLLSQQQNNYFAYNK